MVLACSKQKMLRVVVREDLSFEMASDLVSDMDKCIEWLDHHFIYSGQRLLASGSHTPSFHALKERMNVHWADGQYSSA